MANVYIDLDELSHLYGTKVADQIKRVLGILGDVAHYDANEKQLRMIAGLADTFGRETWPEARKRRMAEHRADLADWMSQMAAYKPGRHDHLAAPLAHEIAFTLAVVLTGVEPPRRVYNLTGDRLNDQWKSYVSSRAAFKVVEAQIEQAGTDQVKEYNRNLVVDRMAASAYHYMANTFYQEWQAGNWRWFNPDAFLHAWGQDYLLA